MTDSVKPALSVPDQQYAAKLLNAMAGSVTKEISPFSSWMIAGTGAAFAVILNGIDKLGPYLALENIGISIKLFLIAAAMNVLQRLLGSMVASSVAAGKRAEKIAAPAGLDVFGVLDVVESTTWYPVRWLTRRSFNKAKRGDFLGPPRYLVALAQCQAWMVFTQIALLVYAGWILAPNDVSKLPPQTAAQPVNLASHSRCDEPVLLLSR